MTAMLQPLGPMAVLLEGGYNLSATAASTEACLRVLLGQRPAALPFEDRAPSAAGLAVIQQVIRTQVSLPSDNPQSRSQSNPVDTAAFLASGFRKHCRVLGRASSCSNMLCNMAVVYSLAAHLKVCNL